MKRRMRGLLLLRGTHSCGNTHHVVTAHNVKYLVVISLPVHLTVDSSVLEMAMLIMLQRHSKSSTFP